MKYIINSLGFWSMNVLRILNKKYIVIKRKQIIQNLQHEPYYIKQGMNSRDTDTICEQLKNKLKVWTTRTSSKLGKDEPSCLWWVSSPSFF